MIGTTALFWTAVTVEDVEIRVLDPSRQMNPMTGERSIHRSFRRCGKDHSEVNGLLVTQVMDEPTLLITGVGKFSGIDKTIFPMEWTRTRSLLEHFSK